MPLVEKCIEASKASWDSEAPSRTLASIRSANDLS
jgi:hypothetical protein